MSRVIDDSIYQPLRWTYGLVPLLAGLDKFFNLLANWQSYLSPVVVDLLPMSPAVFMRCVGVVEIVVGLLVLTKWPRLGAWLATVWLVAIAINLVIAGDLDVAVRDLAMAVGAYTLVQLATRRQQAGASAPTAGAVS